MISRQENKLMGKKCSKGFYVVETLTFKNQHTKHDGVSSAFGPPS
jgi:hypothetical protein